jgi:RNA polymerase sigma-70 factor (ECF subfamily)
VAALMIFSEQDFALLKKRNKEVLTRFYEQYEARVATYFYIRTFCNQAVADDLTQETFCAFIDYSPRVKSRKHVQFTLFTIARNKLADYQRRLFRERKRNKRLKDTAEPDADIITEIHNRQKALLFSLAIESLNERYREVYEMHYVKEMPIKEIASHYNTTYKSIDGILCRIREKLKKEIARVSRAFF